MIHVVDCEPGHLIAMHALPAPGRRLSLRRTTYRDVQAQMAVSEAYALFETPDELVPFAIVGGAPWPTGDLEMWFVVRPGGLAPALLLSFVRFARAMLGKRPPAVCYVEGSNREGARLARLLGFEKAAGQIGSYDEWRRG